MTFTASRWRRTWHACALAAWLLAGTVAAQAQTAPTACPPVAQPPTAEQAQAAMQGASDRGFLWRASKDGRTSWLYGTVHLGKLEWLFPGPAVRAALAAMDTLALELDLTDPAVGPALAAAMAGQSPALALTPALHKRLALQVAAACLPAAALDTLHPVMRGITLAVLAARWDGLDPGYAQELMLAGVAHAGRIPVVSLETVALQIDTLIPADARAALAMLVQTLDQLESGHGRKTMARLALAWAQGRLDELEQYESWCDCVADDQDRDLLRRLNDDRNPGLAQRIDALHGSGKRVFAAVGALHMTGPKALPALLAQRGYTLERIAFPP